MRRFAQLELLDDAIPDETTILKFRHMIERHTLSEAIFADINNYLVEKGIQVSQGSMVDATIIQAASSTKNKDKKRDAEMHSTRKNNQYYFGMKIHIGTDVNSNAIHSATITPANTADITELPKLLRERDRVVFADAGYTSDSYKKRSAGIGHELESQRQTKSRERRIQLRSATLPLRGLNQFSKDGLRLLEAKAFPRSQVQPPFYPGYKLIANRSHIGSLRDVLPEQPVKVLIQPALPR